MITANHYEQQPKQLRHNIASKWPESAGQHDKVILLHNNAKLHITQSVRDCKREVLPYLPYSPDITLSNFHLFRSMAHDLAVQSFRLVETFHHKVKATVWDNTIAVPCVSISQSFSRGNMLLGIFDPRQEAGRFCSLHLEEIYRDNVAVSLWLQSDLTAPGETVIESVYLHQYGLNYLSSLGDLPA